MSKVNVETSVTARVDGFMGVAAVTYEGTVDGGRTVESPIFNTKEGAVEWGKLLLAGEVVDCQFDKLDPKAQDTFHLESFKRGLDDHNPVDEPEVSEEQGGEEQPTVTNQEER